MATPKKAEAVPGKHTAMLCDIQYVKPSKEQNLPDYLYIIWRDTVTGEKHLKAVPEPKMTVYFEKPEFRNHNYNRNYAKLTELVPRHVKFTNIIRAIAEDGGEVTQKYLNNAYQSRDYQAVQNMHLYPYVFGSDYDVASWYRIQWLREYSKDVPKLLRKGFLDIEVDGIEVPGMPTAQNCPVNAVTLIDDWNKVSYTFLLVDRECTDPGKLDKYKNMWEEQHWMMDHPDEVDKILHSAFDSFYGHFDYKVYYYNNEAKMLTHVFELINKLKLDFIGIWNMAFDIPYLIDRMVALGLDARKIMSHPDFPSQKCRFKADTRNHDIKNKTDAFLLTSYTTFYCQMELYAAIRKSQSELRSHALNYIAKRELKDSKLDYSAEGDIKELPYQNFLKFFLYNVKDVLLQVGIERRTSDFDTLYLSSFANATSYDKVFKQTVKLRNVQYISFLEQGLIPGANINIHNHEVEKTYDDEDEEDDDDEFEGALVADPDFNDYVGVELYGRKTNNVFNNAIDFDMSSFYPNSIMAMNIDPSTLIFKVIMPARQFDMFDGPMYLRGITRDCFNVDDDTAKECFDNFQTGNTLVTGWKWMGLPNVYDTHQYMKEVIKKRRYDDAA